VNRDDANGPCLKEQRQECYVTDPQAAPPDPDVDRHAAPPDPDVDRHAAPTDADVDLHAAPPDPDVDRHAAPTDPDVDLHAAPPDPDVDRHLPAVRSELHAPVLAAASAGGVAGALARYTVAIAWPHPPSGFPWSTFVINVTGCFLIGILMVIVTEVVTHKPLLRPFLGVGVIGGYTTFSTYVVDIQRTAGAGALLVAFAYLALTLVGALLAVYAGTALTRAAVRR
jgi:CrcB protein